MRVVSQQILQLQVGLTGTGYFDMLAYGKYNDGLLTDYAPTDEEIEKGFAGMPVID